MLFMTNDTSHIWEVSFGEMKINDPIIIKTEFLEVCEVSGYIFVAIPDFSGRTSDSFVLSADRTLSLVSAVLKYSERDRQRDRQTETETDRQRIVEKAYELPSRHL